MKLKARRVYLLMKVLLPFWNWLACDWIISFPFDFHFCYCWSNLIVSFKLNSNEVNEKNKKEMIETWFSSIVNDVQLYYIKAR